MTTEQIDEIIAPAQDSIDAVFDWLSSQNLRDVSELNWRGNVILVNTTVEKAEQLLAAEYSSFSKNRLTSTTT
jgi:hypothetical protein